MTILYTLLSESGAIIDQTPAEGVIVDLSEGQLPQPLVAALQNADTGDAFELALKAEEAYGPRDEQLVTRVPRGQFADIPDLAPGMQLEARLEDGIEVVWVRAVEAEHVVIDLNHPLAGIDLIFKVKVIPDEIH